MSTEEIVKEPVKRLALSREEAADALGISVQTLDRLASQGKIKPNRATRRPLYSPAELERFVNAPHES